MAYICGVDIGGTFTDAVVIDDEGTVTLAKSPSTPDDFARGFFAALGEAAAARGLELEALLDDTVLLSHGTTVATNAVVERRGAKVGLITTAGHGDALLIMRAYGRAAGLSAAETLRFSVTAKPEPLVPRSLIREVAERIDRDGAVVVVLDEAALERAVDELVALGVEAVAVSFLWAFRNPQHERRARDIVTARAPGLFVTCSHELAPRLGEYERGVAAVMNSYVGPITSRYVERIAAQAAHAALDAPFLLMQCNGGLAGAASVTRNPLLLLQSGPCGGVVGARALGTRLGHRDIIATDMGGTTFDVGLVHAGEPLRTATTIVHQYAFYVPTIDVKSVGAGGGSIAWYDATRGALSVGPHSAGAKPGPVCYGRGGSEPTVTDADVVLGYVDPDYFLGGRARLDRVAAFSAIAALGERLGLDPFETAAGINRIVDTHMADLIRRETIEKGLDPRDFVVYSYGGGGPVHAGAYARELGCRAVVVPLADIASVFSAFGIAASDVMHVYERELDLSAPWPDAPLAAALTDLRAEALATLAAEGFAPANVTLAASVDMRHHLQVHVVEVPLEYLADSGTFADKDLVTAFTARYEALYGAGTAYGDAGIELVTLRLRASAGAHKPALRPRPLAPPIPSSAALATPRMVYWTEQGGLRETPVYRAAALLPGNVIDGPAIIEPTTTTIVVHPGQRARVDPYGNIVLELVTPANDADIASGTRGAARPDDVGFLQEGRV